MDPTEPTNQGKERRAYVPVGEANAGRATLRGSWGTQHLPVPWAPLSAGLLPKTSTSHLSRQPTLSVATTPTCIVACRRPRLAAHHLHHPAGGSAHGLEALPYGPQHFLHILGACETRSWVGGLKTAGAA